MKKRKKRQKRKPLKLFGIIMGSLAIFLLLVYLGGRAFVYIGGNRLYKNASSEGPVFTMEEEAPDEKGSYAWQEGWIRYNGDIYKYNEEILTFLILGIDKEGEVTAAENRTDGGQSDAMFLLIINPSDTTISLLVIDRNTMTDIKMVGMGEDGSDIIRTAQIAVQHGFGDGGKRSCELARDTVSALLYDLPVHGYVSVNYEAIPYINDSVGGVEVIIPEDAAAFREDWNTGEQVLLKGQEAIEFVKRRDITVFESARRRAARQKTYLTTFAAKAMAQTKSDITFPLNLYNQVKSYIVTDISPDEISYLASRLINYHFDGDRIYTMEGETIMGEKFEEFYPDMDALKELMIQLFYEKVDAG